MGETCGSGNGKGPVDLFIHIRLISPISLPNSGYPFTRLT